MVNKKKTVQMVSFNAEIMREHVTPRNLYFQKKPVRFRR